MKGDKFEFSGSGMVRILNMARSRHALILDEL